MPVEGRKVAPQVSEKQQVTSSISAATLDKYSFSRIVTPDPRAFKRARGHERERDDGDDICGDRDDM